MSRNKIGFKLGLMLLGAFAAVLLTLGLTVNRVFTNFYNAEMRTEVDELTNHFASMSESHTPGEGADEALLQFADFSNVSFVVVSESGEVLERSGDHDASDRSYIHPGDLKRLFAGEAVELEHRNDRGERYFIAARPIAGGDSAGDGVTAAVYVLSSTRQMEESISSVRHVLWLAGAGAFVLALGFAWIIARLLTRPLLQMQAATRRIAAGELETRLAIRRNDEIGVLSDSINHLAVELQRYRDTRQEFLANISHELRTPITYLEGYARVLRQRLYDTEEEKDKYLDIIHEEAKRVERLVDDLFDLAKMEEGVISLSLEWIDLAEIADNAVRKIRLKADAKQLSLRTDLAPGTPLVFGDGLRLEQIVLNLLENAVRYTEKGGIAVELGQRSGRVFLAVEDTGIGIPEEEAPYIFDRFYRVEKSRSRRYGGSGLGLAIARKLVELQGGELGVESRPGRGSRFEIRLDPGRREEDGPPEGREADMPKGR
ncbi:sensor histidine kinase [Paenibacillus glufosinatiresistens]|uniref:sensor histidine kinase n=1 Tax=Paenibacillus glufosinatiresistens TaxID=3070657 RepID=UPI00286E2B75|nr:HAMP domain-containing sensor histidine kinase [Paenibacillus sp. YX.27]